MYVMPMNVDFCILWLVVVLFDSLLRPRIDARFNGTFHFSNKDLLHQ